MYVLGSVLSPLPGGALDFSFYIEELDRQLQVVATYWDESQTRFMPRAARVRIKAAVFDALRSLIAHAEPQRVIMTTYG